MAEKEATTRLRPITTYGDWKAVVEQELKGASFDKRLVSPTPEGIGIQPLYRREALGEAAAISTAVRGLLAGARQEDGTAPRSWTTESEPEYEFSPLPALAAALARRPGPGRLLPADPLGWLVTHGELPMALDACLKDLAAGVALVDEHAASGHVVAVGAQGWHEAGATAVQELAFVLATGAEYWRALRDGGIAPDRIGPRLRLGFAVGVDFYMEIAKLRAARVLWAKLSRAFGAAEAGQRVFLAVRTASGDKTIYDPQVNLLRITTQALAGVIGGADAIDIRPFDEVAGRPDELGERMSRNLHEILGEEFFLGRQVDPAGGGWHVEALTDELGRRAWTLFQEIERGGGMAAAIVAGRPQQQVAKTAAERQRLIDTRRRAVLGTSIHPNLREEPKPPADASAPVPPVTAEAIKDFAGLTTAVRHAGLPELRAGWSRDRGPGPQAPALKPWRAAAAFEEVRRAGDNFLVRTGRRARVFLARMGSPKQHKARAGFAAGFFAPAGFEVTEGKICTTAAEAADAAVASGAEIAVLCSTDDTYPELAPTFARRAKAARPGLLVVLAGHPGEHEADYRNAGFDEFIHLRVNVRTTLARLQQLAGVLS